MSNSQYRNNFLNFTGEGVNIEKAPVFPVY
jgi:hypothetical protein